MAYYTDKQLDKMRETLKKAKENPTDPKSQEIFKRINSGQMNFELKALGISPVKVERPKVDMKQALMAGGAKEIPAEDFATGQGDVQRFDSGLVEMPRGEMSEVGGVPADKAQPGRTFSRGFLTSESRAETKEDIGQMFNNVGEELVGGVQRGIDMWSQDDISLGNKVLTSLIEPVSGVMGAVGETVVGLGKGILFTEEAERKIGEMIKNAGQAATETEAYQKVAPEMAEWWSNLDPNTQQTLKQSGKFAELIAEVVTLGMAGQALKQTGRGLEEGAGMAKRGADTLQPTLEGAARATGEMIDQSMAGRRAAQVAEQEAKATNAVGRILQAGDDQRAIESAKRALSELDTTNVNTYDDLNNAITDQITGYSRAVDLELDKVPGTFTKDDLVKTTQVGDELVTENPVEQAIQGLLDAYNKSGETAKAVRIRQLNEKLETEGLTLREVNELAREYGIEYRDRAFTKKGDPKTGYNADSYENIRSGVKEVLRDKMPNDATKELDRKISDLYTTRDLTAKIEDKVAKLEQRITNRTLAQKVGGAVADIADLATAGMLRGFTTKLLPSNVGNKAMNSLDIQNELRKNLEELTRLTEMKDDKKFADAFEEYMKNLPVGMSIRSSVSPQTVAPQLTNKEFDLMADAIGDVQNARLNPEFNEMLDKYGLTRATDDELDAFMKETTSEADIPGSTEKDVGSFNESATTKTTDLLEEARKYDSAEEFVRSQPIVYHGSPVPLEKFDNKKGGVFFTEDYYEATGFAGTPDNTYEGFLNFKKPLVVDAKGAKWDEINTPYGNSTQEVVSKAGKDGYDGIVFKNIIDNTFDDAEVGTPGNIYYAYNPEDAFVNESQLEDIWKQANEQGQ